MKTQLLSYSENQWKLTSNSQKVESNSANLVLCFGSKELLISENPARTLAGLFPNADIVCTSTSGEILDDRVYDNSLMAVAFKFEKTIIKAKSISVHDFADSFEAAVFLMRQLEAPDLAYTMVYSDGALVNGSELVKGLSNVNGERLVTGGLAGDADRFKSTLVGLNEEPCEGNIVAIGFYGDEFMVSHGSQGGWESFGLEREVTASKANVLKEIDGENALDLYKIYLGDAAKELPGAALLYPLSVLIPGGNTPIVRTILSIDETNQTMTFAGDVPVGSKVKLMKANFNKLTVAASNAAAMTNQEGLPEDSFALLVSCVGRKLVLGPRIEDEVEAVKETLGSNVLMAGFYSYGEISPFNTGGACQLHNQTMTITTFYELS